MASPEQQSVEIKKHVLCYLAKEALKRKVVTVLLKKKKEQLDSAEKKKIIYIIAMLLSSVRQVTYPEEDRQSNNTLQILQILGSNPDVFDQNGKAVTLDGLDEGIVIENCEGVVELSIRSKNNDVDIAGIQARLSEHEESLKLDDDILDVRID